MSKPAHGDPSIDIEARKQAIRIKKTMNRAYCRNLDIKTAKLLAKTLKHAIAELDDAIFTKLKQSIGGMQGAKKRHASAR